MGEAAVKTMNFMAAFSMSVLRDMGKKGILILSA